MIHAKKGYVRIDPIALSDQTYYAARRVIQSNETNDNRDN